MNAPFRGRTGPLVAGALCIALQSNAHADPPASPKEPAEPTLEAAAEETIDVVEDAPMTAASARDVRDGDFRLRRHSKPADLLDVVPGLFLLQHAGGGKANQYFLRGFDADHGTDLSINVDGVPVNLPSHGHGQGYADLHFLIPELVERVEVTKGPYFPDQGDFATAGSVNLVLRRKMEDSSLAATGGRWGTVRLVGIASPKLDGLDPLLAGEVHASNGATDIKERLRRLNLLARASHRLGEHAEVGLTATAYSSQWSASNQVPLRAVRAGQLGFFGGLDPTDGGGSDRHSATLTLKIKPTDLDEVTLLAYAIKYDFSLYSNFTFFAADEARGDQIQQTDDRVVFGTKARYHFHRTLGEALFSTTFGLDARRDGIENAIWHTAARERLEQRAGAEIGQSTTSLFVQEDLVPVGWLRAMLGVRADYLAFEVKDRLEDLTTQGTRASGLSSNLVVSPKASAVFTPLARTDVYLNFGAGYHSNDARANVSAQANAMPATRALGYEVGVRTAAIPRLDLAAAVYLLDLDSETVWVGDEGTTEQGDATRRYGAEFEARVRLLTWLFADADVTVNHGEFVRSAGNGAAIALAPKVTYSGGVSARHPSGVYGRVSLRGVTDRPATQDGFLVAEGFSLVDLTLGYRYRFLEVAVAVENLLDARWREAQFATVTRLAGEASTMAPPPPGACPGGTRVSTAEGGNFAGCEDVSFTPGSPLNVQATVTVYF